MTQVRTRELNLEAYRRYRDKHPERHMLKRAFQRAKKYELEFNLVEDDIHIPDKCPILGIPLYFVQGKALEGGRKNSPSLDRIDNSKGYIKDNVQVISHLANTMKSNASLKELETFAKYILRETHGD